MRPLWLFLPPALLYPALAWAGVELEPGVNLWNLGGALVLIGGGWMALKGRLASLETRQSATEERLEECLAQAHQNHHGLLGLKSEIYERLMDQERLLFEKMDERIRRIESKLDRLIEKGNGR